MEAAASEAEDYMSSNQKQSGSQTSDQDMHAAVWDVFNSFATGGVQPRLRSISGSCQFEISGAGTWRVTLTDGVPTVIEGSTVLAPADCVLSCDATDFLRIVKRENHLNLFAAFLQGVVTFTGDLAFASTLLGGVVREPSTTTAV